MKMGLGGQVGCCVALSGCLCESVFRMQWMVALCHVIGRPFFDNSTRE